MELTHVSIHGTNTGAPPRRAKTTSLPLTHLWKEEISQETRNQLLRVLSQIAAECHSKVAQITHPSAKEVSDE